MLLKPRSKGRNNLPPLRSLRLYFGKKCKCPQTQYCNGDSGVEGGKRAVHLEDGIFWWRYHFNA